MCCSFILKALHFLGSGVCHFFAPGFTKHGTSIMSSRVFSEYLLDIYSCNIKVAVPSPVACHNDLFNGKIHSLITCWIKNVLLISQSRFWTMPVMKKFPFRILWQVLNPFKQFREGERKWGKEREIHHFSASKVRRKLCKPEKNIAQNWSIMTVSNVNDPFFLSKITETWTVVTDNW